MNRKKMYLVVGGLAFFLLANIFFVISRSDTATLIEARAGIFIWWGLRITSGLALLAWSLGRKRKWPAVVLLLAVIGASAYWYLPWSSYWPAGVEQTTSSIHPTSDTTFVAVVRPGQPVEVVMPVGWGMEWWRDLKKLDSHVKWQGPNKIRVFTTKAGVDETVLRFRIYPCSARTPC